ncbi:ceramide glucosyltransferase-like [Coccinella septempunctata]|uniref:ceramide glucosyltransferase-like n=1 Tax=Coccinella septempunctata TaxID=41139 RepID=UPI001D082B9B|nr:ceramide glucosyltransferase-like [Coccinella septempunctata]
MNQLNIDTIYVLALAFFTLWSALWIVHILAILHGKFRLHRKKTEICTEDMYPGVSILKPLTGIDPNLAENLESFFTLAYPRYEILFCVENDKDPALKIVQELMEKYPNIVTKVFKGASKVGANPKINNIYKAFQDSVYDLILVSDSGIKMKNDTLLDMVAYMTDKTGLVHQMPYTSDKEGFPAVLEKIYFGTVQSRIYLAADFLRRNCHTGMSTLLRKSVLEGKGGLKTFGCYLAEDFFICRYFKEKGWRTTISSQPAMQNSGVCDISYFQARMTRWAQLRVAMIPLVIIFEPLSECMVIGVFAAWASSVLFQWNYTTFYLTHILTWFLCDWILITTVQNGALPFNKFKFVVGWLVRECSGPYIFFNALITPDIQWRNRVFKLSWGGVIKDFATV